MSGAISSNNTCPSCTSEMQKDSIFCIKCGYHLKFRKHLKAASGSVGQPSNIETTNPYASLDIASNNSLAQGTFLPGFLSFLFSFQGRITRLTWWVYQVVWYGIVIAIFEFSERVIQIPDSMKIAGGLLMIVSRVAVDVKRLHDFSKPGFHVFRFFMPLIGPILRLIDLGFQDGTFGSNEYGEDPLKNDPKRKPYHTPIGWN